MFSEAELPLVGNFREWLQSKGAYLHPALRFVKDVSGMSVLTIEDMPRDCQVASCPFALAITPHSSKDALLALCKLNNVNGAQLEALIERELICTYIVMHWLLEEERDNSEFTSTTASMFHHLPYLRTLPTADVLRTSLHFNEEEMLLLRGTNLYGATIDRRQERQLEWERCRTCVETLWPMWKDRFTWQKYLTATTYLSSRAFPSTMLSPTPSLTSTPSSHPVLIPVIDCFNHSRGRRVSWMVDSALEFVSPPAACPSLASDAYQISLIVHDRAAAHTEIFNNYGLKPNSELILGYGFSLPANPDDTIVLKIGGRPEDVGGHGRSWEVGRNARGSEGLWEEMLAALTPGLDDGEEVIADWELELEAAEALIDMVEQKLRVLPHDVETIQEGVRADVLEMIQHYVEGQKNILQSLSAFADSKRECAISKAQQEGLELVFDEETVDRIE